MGGAALTQGFLLAVEKIQEEEDLRNEARLNNQKIDEKLKEFACDFYRVVPVKDRTFRLVTYKRCFTGKGAVDALIQDKLASTRQEACKLAQSLMDQDVFHHVLGEHNFKDSRLFYRFRVDAYKCDFIAPDTVSGTDLEEIAKKLHTGLDIKDRRYHMKIYKSCFLGSHCVAYMLEHQIAKSEKEAIDIGNKLVDAKIISHVTKDHKFCNKNYFYKFIDRKPREKSITTGEAVSEGFSEVKTPQAARLLQLLEWHFKLGSKYTPQPYSGRVSLIRCTSPFKPSRYEGWFSTCELLTVTNISANHYNVVADPHCTELADIIRTLLQDVEL